MKYSSDFHGIFPINWGSVFMYFVHQPHQTFLGVLISRPVSHASNKNTGEKTGMETVHLIEAKFKSGKYQFITLICNWQVLKHLSIGSLFSNCTFARLGLGDRPNTQPKKIHQKSGNMVIRWYKTASRKLRLGAEYSGLVLECFFQILCRSLQFRLLLGWWPLCASLHGDITLRSNAGISTHLQGLSPCHWFLSKIMFSIFCFGEMCMYSILFHFHIYHVYIYIQINFNETSTIDTHQKCRTPLSFIPVWVLRRGESTASQTQLRDCTRPGPPTVGVGVQQWTRFFFLIDIPFLHPCMVYLKTFTIDLSHSCR